MWTPFVDKTLKILVIDSAAPVRQMIADALREKGFENITGLGTVKDALHLMEVEQIDWVLSSILDSQEYSLINILKLFIEEPTLKKPKITALLAAEESSEYLLYLYENGLFSHIEKPFNKVSLSDSIEMLSKDLENFEFDVTRVSAKFVIKELEIKKDFETIVVAVENLLNLYPGDPDLMLTLVESLCLLGKMDRGLNVLKHLKLLNQKDAEVKKIALELFNIKNSEDLLKHKGSDESAFSIYGVENAVIVDNDSTIKSMVVGAFTKMGVKNIMEFEDGEAAWAAIDALEKEPEIILMEWKIPKVSGPYLMQRIHYKFPLVPIVVGSSLIQPSDVTLLKEMGVTDILMKPYNQGQVINKILEVLQKERLPKDAADLEVKIRQNIEADNLKDALYYWEKYNAMDDLPRKKKVKIEAELAYAQKNYDIARDLTIKAITFGDDSVILLNLLAKCFIQLDDQESAVKCLEKAKQMSPRNIERLCMIAEVQHSLGEAEKSASALKEAKAQDPTAPRVQETDIKIAISIGSVDSAKDLMNNLSSINNVIAYMNNRAVVLARQGDLEQSLGIYKNTLESIPEDNLRFKALVQYNLVLAHIRKGELAKAIQEIDIALTYKVESLKAKLTNLRTQIEAAHQKGLKVALDSSISKNNKVSKEQNLAINQSIVKTINVAPGDYCCFKLFTNPDFKTAKVKELLAKKTPTFKRRETLERSESGDNWKSVDVS